MVSPFYAAPAPRPVAAERGDRTTIRPHLSCVPQYGIKIHSSNARKLISAIPVIRISALADALDAFPSTLEGSVALIELGTQDTVWVSGSKSALSSAPAGYRFPREVIAVGVRWYLAMGCPIAMWRSFSPSAASRSIT
jgi:hypothetical protein